MQSSGNFSFFSEKDHKQPRKAPDSLEFTRATMYEQSVVPAAWPVGSNRGFGLIVALAGEYRPLVGHAL